MRKDRLLIGSPLDDCCRNRGVTKGEKTQKRGVTFVFINRKIPGIFLLCRKIGMTILFCLLSTTVHAECTPVPDCAELGYTADNCEGKFVRCPFNTSKLFCIPCDSSYKYTCLGDNITGGSGMACSNKYISCICSEGATFKNGECVCDMSYQYTCSGTGYVSGFGVSCSGKYIQCTCADGYIWRDGECIYTHTHSYSCPSGYSRSCDCGYSATKSKVCSCGKISSDTCYKCNSTYFSFMCEDEEAYKYKEECTSKGGTVKFVVATGTGLSQYACCK